jgi:hypothetical protein
MLQHQHLEWVDFEDESEPFDDFLLYKTHSISSLT